VLEANVADVRVGRALDVGEMSRVVMNGLERSRRVTEAGLYLRDPDGTGFECTSSLGEVPGRIEVATARVLLERLEKGSLLLEALEQEVAESDRRGRSAQSIDAVRAWMSSPFWNDSTSALSRNPAASSALAEAM
jgi:hypothetical protein